MYPSALPKNVICKDTVGCLQSGMTYGMASMIDGAIRKMKEEAGNSKVIITGGEARYINSVLEEEVIYDENLLLDGLKILYNKNK